MKKVILSDLYAVLECIVIRAIQSNLCIAVICT